MFVHGFTTADNIVKDLAKVFTTGDFLEAENNYELVYPDPSTQTGATAEEKLEAALDSIEDIFTIKMTPKNTRRWIKKEPQTVDEGATITVDSTILTGGGTRVYVRDKKYYLYLKKDDGELDILEYRIVDDKTIEVNESLVGKQVLVDYEKPVGRIHLLCKIL